MSARTPAAVRVLVDGIVKSVSLHPDIAQIDWGWVTNTGKDPSAKYTVFLYPCPIETVGGANDGAWRIPGLSWDVGAVVNLFDEIEQMTFSTVNHTPSDDFRDEMGRRLVALPSLSITGRCRRTTVTLIFAGTPPPSAPPVYVEPTGKRRDE
jgi:hypothetical protein